MIRKYCNRDDCFAWTSRYANGCSALEELTEEECKFYKSRGTVKDEREAMRRRAETDPYYCQLLLEYGIKFKHRGRKPNGRD